MSPGFASKVFDEKFEKKITTEDYVKINIYLLKYFKHLSTQLL